MNSADMEYKVNLALTIWDAEHKKFMGGSKEVTLPFPPYEGLVLSEREGWYRINQVTWSMAERCFYCKIEIEEIEMEDGYDLDMKFLSQMAIKNGYEGFDTVCTINS